jgi:hypothetical protein
MKMTDNVYGCIVSLPTSFARTGQTRIGGEAETTKKYKNEKDNILFLDVTS